MKGGAHGTGVLAFRIAVRSCEYTNERLEVTFELWAAVSTAFINACPMSASVKMRPANPNIKSQMHRAPESTFSDDLDPPVWQVDAKHGRCRRTIFHSTDAGVDRTLVPRLNET